jgi:hypothetical protein
MKESNLPGWNDMTVWKDFRLPLKINPRHTWFFKKRADDTSFT